MTTLVTLQVPNTANEQKPWNGESSFTLMNELNRRIYALGLGADPLIGSLRKYQVGETVHYTLELTKDHTVSDIHKSPIGEILDIHIPNASIQ